MQIVGFRLLVSLVVRLDGRRLLHHGFSVILSGLAWDCGAMRRDAYDACLYELVMIW